MKARITGTNPRTVTQHQQRSLMGATNKLWSYTLTGGQRNAWVAFAATNPVLNKLGNVTTLSGHGWFSKINLGLLKGGNAAVLNPPVSTAVDTPTSFTLDVQATPTKHVKFTQADANLYP